MRHLHGECVGLKLEGNGDGRRWGGQRAGQRVFVGIQSALQAVVVGCHHGEVLLQIVKAVGVVDNIRALVE